MKTKRQFDTLVFSQLLYAENKPAMAFRTRTKKQALAWQKILREKLAELLGGFPEKSCALNPEALETKPLLFKDRAGKTKRYVRQKIYFDTRKNLSCFGYFLRPENVPPKNPCIICLPGHGRGVDDIVGISENGALRRTYGGYQNDFALQCVANGFSALAIEPLCFGHRRDSRVKKSGASSCQPAAGAAFLFGQTMVGWRVYDVMRAIDYLETREEINREKIGVMGISGGGAISFFSAALDTRIGAAVISGYFNTFRDSIMSIPHCLDNYVPDLLRWAEMYDLAGLIAPRPLFIESGTKDPLFPVKAARKSFRKARGIYAAFKAGENIGLEIFSGKHIFYGQGAFRFLEKIWR